ncbi:MAG: hypothetical protein C5B60_11450 [Chloroflexi bacterium]|nr:MAG: hypothetical protein C5B60_11450 [Chloroflexota bacterium]
MTFQDYPRWMYHRTKPAMVISNEEEEAALGAEWSRDIRVSLPKEDKPQPIPEPEEPEPEEEEEVEVELEPEKPEEEKPKEPEPVIRTHDSRRKPVRKARSSAPGAARHRRNAI